MTMRYTTAAAFRDALEARLRAESQASARSLQRLRRIVTFDRLLARLLVVAPDRWVLKGALALDFRLGGRMRFTRDMDLGRNDDAEMATEDMIAAQTCDLGDYFVFQIQRTDRLAGLREGAAVRYHLRVQVAGRIFEETIVDIGFGDTSSWSPQVISPPNLLSFAGIAPITVPVLPLERHVAEKLHAYTRGYGDGSIVSTRVKDLVDLALIAELSRFDAQALRSALVSVFAERGRAVLPFAVPPPPLTWRDPYAQLAASVGLSPNMHDGHLSVAAFLHPLLRTPDFTGIWNNALGQWNSLPLDQ